MAQASKMHFEIISKYHARLLEVSCDRSIMMCQRKKNECKCI